MPEETVQTVNDRLTLHSYREGLSLGTDTLLLASFIRGGPSLRAAELGSGTGILSMLVASRQKADRILLLEIQESYVALSRRNLLENGLADRLTVVQGDVRNPDAAALPESFDLLFSNPPYYRENSGPVGKHPEDRIARCECNGTIFDFAKAAARLLRYGGSFFLVYLPERMADLFQALRQAGLEPKRLLTVYPSSVERPNLILAEARKGGNPGLLWEAPLFLYSDKTHREETPEMKRIHDGMDLSERGKI